ncbi:cyclic nucleotide-binding/CBS domain-containing protein [Halorientalis brevis]|uniref:Cyclic nucleotide-binding/CBS domain-containing protein n=1 Tax=Halorientalis brevis TaxID=1126241 RepID=A0ABD6C959_9EURY|nr:CBS domain-containing protein [Halorientalis brevis]
MIDIPVANVMTRGVETITGEETAAGVARRFAERQLGSLVVVDPDSGTLTGIVTESDVIQQVAANGDMETVPVSTFMSAPVVTIESTEPIHAAADLMKRHSIRRLPVVDGGQLVGIVTTTNLTHYLPKLRNTILRERGTNQNR